MGGAYAVLEKARTFYDAGDFRWVAQFVNHAIFAQPNDAAVRELQAAALPQEDRGFSLRARWPIYRLWFPPRPTAAAWSGLFA